MVVEESGGDYRRYLKKDCNRSDILHQPVKGKKIPGGGASGTGTRDQSTTLALIVFF